MKHQWIKGIFLIMPLLFCFSGTALSQTKPLQAFPLSGVRLLDGPFKEAQQTDLRYILALNPDRLLAPYLAEAGIASKAERYGNWENTGLDGHIGGHYLSALAYMYAATGDPQVRQHLRYMIDQLELCQQKNGNGYVGGIPGGRAMWKEVAQGKIRAESFALNGKWVPWYNLHKLYAGLRDAYWFAGEEKAKRMLVELTDWCLKLTAELSDAQIQTMLQSEHGGLSEVFADVAAITGDKKYLQLARRFSHQAILTPLLAGKDALNGLHANTQIPKVIGYQRIAELSGERTWSDAAAFFWKTVVDHRTVSIGGNSVREHFHPATDFSSMMESKEGPETCNTYNMLKLTRQLYLQTASTDYIEYYERALYNHILSSQHPKGGFVYFTPMRPRHYRVYSQPQESFWCCVGSGLENHGKYGELIYAHTANDLYVNLFMASQLTWPEKRLTLTQQTRLPYEEATQLTLTLSVPQRFALYLRRPVWVKKQGLVVRVNGEIVQSQESASYVTVERTWKTGDVVTLTLPMQTKAEYLPDQSPWVSFVHGPVVLAAVTGTEDMAGLRADTSRMGHIADGTAYSIDEAPVIVAKQPMAGLKPVEGRPLTFSLSNLAGSQDAKPMELVPFFAIHDARYMLYWPVASPEELEVRKKALRQREQERLALEARTLDGVSPGEQQPESDHHYQGENTQAGVHRDRHWRHASGWFSYDLKDANQQARTLQVTYYGLDKDRHFAIYANDVLVATVHSDGSRGDTFFEVDYPLPAQVFRRKKGGMVQVKFVALQNSIAGGIYGLRLLK